MKWDDHKKVIKERELAQEVESDLRDEMRDLIIMDAKKDGFWEDTVYEDFETYNRPRFSFNKAKGKLNKAWGELASQEVQVNVKPASGDGEEKTAAILAGLFRATEYDSRAQDIYAKAARRGMVCGFDCAMIEQEYCDPDSFDQTLFIRSVPDAINRVWFFGNWQSNVAEDAEAVTVDHHLSDDELEELFGEDKAKAAKSLSDHSRNNSFCHNRSGTIVSQLFYKKWGNKKIYQLPDGDVIGEEDYKELEKAGADLSGVKSKVKRSYKICSRFYDSENWLNEEEETVFDLLPVVPLLPYFEIINNKPTSRGMMVDMVDEQRSLNYAASRYISDTALAQKGKIFAVKDHFKNYADKLKTINKNNDPVQFYDHVDGVAPPFVMDAPAVNPALLNVIELARGGLDDSSGMFGPADGKQFARQSAEAIEMIQHKGDVGQLEFFNATKRFILQLAKICIRAYPRLHDTEKEVRTIGEDGSYENAVLYEVIQTENGPVKVNDLTEGSYDVYCDIGVAFRSKREETVRKIESLGAIDPSIIEEGKDIFVGAIDAPGMDKLAERIRIKKVNSGQIPESQLTDEERKMVEAAAAQPQQPDPAALIAQAETEKAQAQTQKVQAATQVALIKAEQAQQKMDFEQTMQQIELQNRRIDSQYERQSQMVQMLNTMAGTLNKISASMGADAIVSPAAAEAYTETAQSLADKT